MKSWKTVIFGLMGFILFCMASFMLWTNVNYYEQIEQTYQKENDQTVQVWGNLVNSRLSAMDEHLYELMLTIYNKNVNLRAGSDIMQYMVQQECLSLMTDKIMISDDISCIYIIDTDSDLMLFDASGGINYLEAASMKQFVRGDNVQTCSLNAPRWQVCEVNENTYFACAVSFGRYVVGAMSSVENYDISEYLHVMGAEVSCMVLEGEQLHYVSGENWTDAAQIEADGSIQFSDINILISSCALPKAGSTVILAAQHNSIRDILSSSLWVYIMVSLLCIALFLILFFVLRHMVSRPIAQMILATKEIRSGNLGYQIEDHADTVEFAALYDNFNDMASQIRNLRIAAYDRMLQKQKDDLTMLRAQIRPHFYLNAITTVVNMTYQDRSEDIRTYLTALAKYMRYMLNLQDKQVMIGEELDHIRNYLQMQRIRFKDSVDAYVGCSSAVEETKVPYLLLFTVVENSIKHAMSLYSTLRLIIQCERIETGDFSGCRVIIEDNGAGFPQKVLDDFQPDSEIPAAKDHFGLTNVSRTLRLTYNRSDLLRLSNAAPNGAHVEIWIPDQYEAAEE